MTAPSAYSVLQAPAVRAGAVRRAWWWFRAGLAYGLIYIGAGIAIVGAFMVPADAEDAE